MSTNDVETFVMEVPAVMYASWALGLVPLSNSTVSPAWAAYSLAVHTSIGVTLVASLYMSGATPKQGNGVNIGSWLVSLMDGTSVIFVTVSHVYKLLSDSHSKLVLRWMICPRHRHNHPHHFRLCNVIYPLLAFAYLSLSWALLMVANAQFWSRVVNSFSCFCNFSTFLVILMFCRTTHIITHEIESLVPVLCANTVAVADKSLALLKVAERLNEFFSPQLLLMCFKVFLSITLGIYRSLTDSKNHKHLLSMTSLCRLLIVSYNIGLLLLVVNACNKCASAAQTFNAELFRLMRKRDDLCSNKKLVLHVTMKKSIKFTACGFFTLSYQLITSIIAGATTYLVILMQLS